MTKQRRRNRLCNGIFVFACLATILFCGSYALSADDELARYRVYTLKQISAEQGKEYLDELELGTVSQLPSPNTLLVTAPQRDLIKATAIFKLVDSKEQFIIQTVCPASAAGDLPSAKQIESQIAGLSVGTFYDLPASDAKAKAIIDVHNDNVIVIAPAGEVKQILFAIDKLQAEAAAKNLRADSKEQIGKEAKVVLEIEVAEQKETEPLETESLEKVLDAGLEQTEKIQTGDADSDELFNKLLSSLTEAEEKVKELEKTEAKPVEPAVVEAAPVEEPVETEKIKSGYASAVEKKREEIVAPKIEEKYQTVIKELVVEPGEIEEEIEVEVKQEPTPAVESETVEVDLPSEKMEDGGQGKTGIRSYKPKPAEIDEQMLDLDLPDELQIIDLLDLVGKYLDLDYMYDSTQIKGTVALRVQGPIQISELYPLAESVLKFRGFVMTRKGNLVTIVPAANVLDIDPVLLDGDGEIRYGDVIVTRIFQLRHIDAGSAKNLLDGMKLGADVRPVDGTGTLIVTGFAYRMNRIEQLLQMVDKPGEPKDFRFRQLRYTMAATLAPKVKTLAEQLGTVSITVAEPAAAPQPEPRTRAQQARAARARRAETPTATGEKTEVYLDADERTNRILMIGMEDQLDTVDILIDSLDVEKQDLRGLRLYEIQNVGAEEVLTKLNELGIISSGGAPSTRRPGRITQPRAQQGRAAQPQETLEEPGIGGPLAEEPQVVIVEATNSLLVNATEEQHTQIATIISYVDSETLEQAIDYVIYPLENQDPVALAEVLQKLIQETIQDKEGKIEQVVKRNEESPVIVADENTFSIIVYASKKDQRWIANLIKTLDKRRPQVLIDVTLVEITQTDEFQYDLDLVTKLPSMNAGGSMEKLAQLLTTFPTADTVIEGSSITTGKAEGFYADRHIQALLTLMKTKDYGRVLAKPKILVNDNEEGKITTALTTYVARSSSTTRVEGETNISTSYTFDEFSSGIDLLITPHISEGSLLRLEIELIRSVQESAGEAENTPPPDKTENNIKTIVTVPDNSTIILGGILQVDQDKKGGKVPFFGDLPLIGGLFRKIDNSDIQNKLYIFVKANILRPDDFQEGLPDLEKISQKNRFAFEEHEKKFQEQEQWPGKSEPMDPLRVLEME